MRATCLTAIAAISFLNSSLLLGAPALVLPNATVGSHLETSATIKFDEPAPDEGLEITVRSSDPNLLRISATADKLGTASLVIKARAGNSTSQEIWLQALGSSGTVTYTAETAKQGSGTGTVTLAPSAILIMGPLQMLKFPTTTGAVAPKIRLVAARLDSSLKLSEPQLVPGGLKVEVSNSNPSAGRLADSPVEIPAGESGVVTLFHAAGSEGDVTFAVKEPSGFTMPAQLAMVTAIVRKPGMVVSDNVLIGQNLEIGGAMALGEFAPVGGLTVTLTSSDPSRLLLSIKQTEPGSKSIQIQFPAEGISCTYFLQALGNSGEVEYTASAPGFRSRTGVVKLSPSGVILTPSFQGPPDEGQVLKEQSSDGSYRFMLKQSEHEGMKLIAWTAQLDPKTHRSADITVQPLRPGISLTVSLTNSNPAVGKTATQVTIEGGSESGSVDFTPAGVGTTEISVVTPENFTVSANSSKVIGTVR